MIRRVLFLIPVTRNIPYVSMVSRRLVSSHSQPMQLTLELIQTELLQVPLFTIRQVQVLFMQFTTGLQQMI